MTALPAPVRCVCGAEARVETSFGSRCDPYEVRCSRCQRRSGLRASRAAALADWAEQTHDLLDKIIHGRA